MSPTVLQAGRELDALVAEKVFGWMNLRFIGDKSLRGEVDGEPSEKVPFYSTDFESAWEVAEKLAEAGLWLTLQGDWHMRQFNATFSRRSNFVAQSGMCDSAPLAICLAGVAAIREIHSRADFSETGTEDME